MREYNFDEILKMKQKGNLSHWQMPASEMKRLEGQGVVSQGLMCGIPIVLIPEDKELEPVYHKCCIECGKDI